MSRPPVIPAEKKIRIVLSILAGEITIAEAARKEKVSEQSIGRWKAEFLEAEVTELTRALGEAAVEVRVWKTSEEGRLGPLRTSRQFMSMRACRLRGSASRSACPSGPGGAGRPRRVLSSQ